MSSNNEKYKFIRHIAKTIGETEDRKAAIQEAGKTALTVTKTVNTILLPLAALNYYSDKVRDYFQNEFNANIEDKTKDIPEDYLIETKASIAGPAIQGLSYSLDEPELKEMYLNLLSTTMDSRVSEYAHPAFVEIIRQLRPDEADLLRDIFSVGLPSIPITQLRDITSSNSYTTVQTYVLNITDEEEGDPICCPEISHMIENLIRLGLVKVEFGIEVNIPNMYDWADKRPEIELIKKKNEGSTMNIQSKKGILSITGLGWDFGKAVGIYT